MITGCPASDMGEDPIIIDPVLCYGCGLCAQTCHRDAIEILTEAEVEGPQDG